MSRINNNIIISVDTTFISNKSVIQNDTYVFSYSINIFNKNYFNIQLLSRYWNITDSNGNLEEIRGPGVIGQTPIIKPGSSFKYSSFCSLYTPFGVMHGVFYMKRDNEKYFDVTIPPFKLIIPGQKN